MSDEILQCTLSCPMTAAREYHRKKEQKWVHLDTKVIRREDFKVFYECKACGEAWHWPITEDPPQLTVSELNNFNKPLPHMDVLDPPPDDQTQLDRIESGVRELVIANAHPFKLDTDGGPFHFCECPEKLVLVESESLGCMTAYEKWCPTHGYQTDCYMCGNMTSTEVCVRHSAKVGEKNDQEAKAT